MNAGLAAAAQRHLRVCRPIPVGMLRKVAAHVSPHLFKHELYSSRRFGPRAHVRACPPPDLACYIHTCGNARTVHGLNIAATLQGVEPVTGSSRRIRFGSPDRTRSPAADTSRHCLGTRGWNACQILSLESGTSESRSFYSTIGHSGIRDDDALQERSLGEQKSIVWNNVLRFQRN